MTVGVENYGLNVCPKNGSKEPALTKVAVILDSSRAFPREHLKFKPITTVYVPVVHTL
jgi:hypothetical protein